MDSIRAAILAVGDELLRGRTQDTNSQFIAQYFEEQGFRISSICVIPDCLDQISAHIKQLAANNHLLLTTGGLGPTSDDLTRDAVALSCGEKLVANNQSLEKLEQYANKRGRKLTDNGRRQAYFPESAQVLHNEIGTADAFITEIKNAEGTAVPVVSLPGVPAEMRKLVEENVMPWAKTRFGVQQLESTCYLRFFGLSESYIGSVIDSLELKSGIGISYRPSFPEVLVTISADSSFEESQREQEAERAQSQIAEAIGAEFAHTKSEKTTLPETLANLLMEKNLTLAAAESCSGGLLAHNLVSISGVSSIFKASLVTYSNDSKETFLGVKRELLETHGAVSKEVACAMAHGARVRSGADIAVSLTGIAGPNGGSAEKPPGTVWIAVSRLNEKSKTEETKAICYNFPFKRNALRRYISNLALDLVRRTILNYPLTWKNQ